MKPFQTVSKSYIKKKKVQPTCEALRSRSRKEGILVEPCMEGFFILEPSSTFTPDPRITAQGMAVTCDPSVKGRSLVTTWGGGGGGSTRGSYAEQKPDLLETPDSTHAGGGGVRRGGVCIATLQSRHSNPIKYRTQSLLEGSHQNAYYIWPTQPNGNQPSPREGGRKGGRERREGVIEKN